MKNLRELLICEAKRIIELLEDDENFKNGHWNSDMPELINKMKEFRRDTIRLEKKAYHRE